jgi:hypothetical protein
MPTSNPSFIRLLEKIQRVIPQVMFLWIFLTYIITAIISIYSIPLPLYMTIPISIIIQGSRFLVVFMNFLNNPQVHKSEIPSKIALFATLLALGELIFTLVENDATFPQNAAVGLFFSSIILMGYLLEIHFIRMGEMVLGQSKQTQIMVEVKKNGLKHATMKEIV